jgi:hypothetical protein
MRVDRPIPGLTPSPPGAAAGFHLHFRSLPRGTRPPANNAQPRWSSPLTKENGEPLLRVYESGEALWFVHDDYQFLVDRRGREGWARWPRRLPFHEMIPWVRGPLLGYVLRLQGACSLHASAVARGGQALAFVGEVGAGKSTLAAALARRGFAAVSDDVLRVEAGYGAAVVYPGYPHICLWPESVGMLCGSDDALPRIIPGWNKRYLDVRGDGHHFAGGPLPLGAIYVLANRVQDNAAPRLEGVAGDQRLLLLASNACASWLADAAARARDFKTFAALAANVPIRRVVAHADASHLPALLDMIERDFDTLIR